ncbi:hypothetical protein HOP50_10g59920 [Chloropicon primus]|uniref:Uncharacterized protein n=1 Tax=Chloropicon primus TaxID=1764295 RepID=A0A5B8MSH5_9CHLO|nr:hypothetical protein A3770_10p59710 [Chloropicon primus]UPR02665.1 hypothetical protein HOP50_10g59920 [Chloropicon primus]|eukprot:QDZ23453.1 hypothetical protein A3770_10p59710 [Chloropicon primus]
MERADAVGGRSAFGSVAPGKRTPAGRWRRAVGCRGKRKPEIYEWELNYRRHIAPKPKISWEDGETDEERMAASESVHDWHEHQWKMLDTLNKLSAVATSSPGQDAKD